MSSVSVPKTLTLSDEENLGTNKWQQQNPNVVRVVSESNVPEYKKEYLDYMAWEYRKFKVRSHVTEFTFRKCEIHIYGAKPFVPGHPQVKMIRFEDCKFSQGAFLCMCPQLEKLYVERCSGVLEIQGLIFKRIYYFNEEDKKCIKLVNSIVNSSEVISTKNFQKQQELGNLSLGDLATLANNKYSDVNNNSFQNSQSYFNLLKESNIFKTDSSDINLLVANNTFENQMTSVLDNASRFDLNLRQKQKLRRSKSKNKQQYNFQEFKDKSKVQKEFEKEVENSTVMITFQKKVLHDYKRTLDKIHQSSTTASKGEFE